MANNNTSSQFSADVENYIAQKTMPLARRQLVAYQFGDPLRLDKHRGTTYTASRYDRVNLPFAPLSEGVPPLGESMPLAQVTVTAQQWGDAIYVTDVADLTIKHPLFQKAIELTGMALAETLERNTLNTLMSGTNVNYVGSVGARSALSNSNILTRSEIERAVAILVTLGAPRYSGDEREDMKIDAGAPTMASRDPKAMPHYVGIIHPLVVQNLREDSSLFNAWSYSDINRLYNYEVGEAGGLRMCQSNQVPSFVGAATVGNGTAGTNGALASGTYYIIVTGAVAQTSVEQTIYQVSAGTVVTGPNGSIAITMPATAGYVYNVYIGTGPTAVANLAQAVGNGVPVSGPLAGQAVQLAPSASVTLTGVGVSRTPPAAPTTGVNVYPTFIIGRNAYGQVVLDDPKFFYLPNADKSDPLNQLRVVGWKVFYGTLIENQNFFCRIEAGSANTAVFT